MKFTSNYPLATPVVGAFRLRDPTEVSDDLSATGTLSVLNVTEAGKLIGLVFRTSTAVAVSVTSRIEITVDGGTTENITIYSAGQQFRGWQQKLPGSIGLGNGSGDAFYLPLGGLEYDTSLVIVHNVTATSGSGTFLITPLRATKQ